VKKNRFILVTGGLGFIGSHTCVELLNCGYKVIVIDNLINSSKKNINRIYKITNKNIIFYKIDIRNKKLEFLFKKYNFYSVIHFAGLKAVADSNNNFFDYFDNNVNGTINLLRIMKKYNCNRFVFSSSACVYDEKSKSPIKENANVNPKSGYGFTKLQIEKILEKLFIMDSKFWHIVILRYFNPIASHPSGFLPENPKTAENIVPKILNVISKKEKFFKIYGDNYQTKDGTCLRDYVHVVDLARSHILALNILKKPILKIFNIGNGKGYSVKDIINEFSKQINLKISFKVTKRREGDVDISYADSNSAKKNLGWKNKYNLVDMCKHTINSFKNYE
jgi:UDP-glucose 4-epimerase